MATNKTLPRPTGHPRAGVKPVFEDFRPTSEWKDDERLNILLLSIHLPGFLTNELNVSTEGKNIIRVRGERLVAGNKWSRFLEDFPVPDDCIMTGIRARLEGGILTITIPRKKKQLQDTNIVPKITPTENFTTKSDPTPIKKADIDPRVVDNKEEIQEIKTPRKKKQLVQDDNSNITPKVTSAENISNKIQEVPTLDQLHIRKQTPNKRADEQRVVDDNKRILNKIHQEQEKKGDENVIDEKNNVTKDYEKITTGQLSRKVQDETKTKLFGKPFEQVKDHDQKVSESKREDNNDEYVGSTMKHHDEDKDKDKDAAVFLEKFKEIKASHKKREKSAAATTSSRVNKVRGLIIDINEERQMLVNMGVAVLVLMALGIQISYTISSNQDAP